MELSDRVRIKRNELGLTQDELARKMSYKSRVSINKIENGRAVTQKIIVKLAEALETTPSYLMGWDDEEKKEKLNKKWNDELGGVTFTDEEFDKLIDYAKFIISQRK